MNAPDSLRLAIEPAWPLPAVLAIAAALAGLVWWTYRPRVRHLSAGTRRTLVGLRLATVALLLVALLRPELRRTETDDPSSAIVILGDASRSMSVPDAPGDKTRRAALVGVLKDNAERLDALDEKFDLRYLDFAATAAEPSPAKRDDKSARGPRAATDAAEGDRTAIGAVLETLLRSAGAKKIAAVLLMTDGAQRSVPPLDADPREVARRYADLGVPIYPVPFGGDGSGDALDLAVEELTVDPLVFEKKAVPVTGKLRLAGAAGKKVTVRILVEDRAGKSPGQSGELQPATATDNARTVKQIEVVGNDAVVPVDLSFVPTRPGEYKIALEVVPLDGEVRTVNNRRETIVNVQKGGLRVAYFDGPLRPEQRWIRNVNTDQKIQLDFVPVRAGGIGRRPIEEKWFEPGKYDAYLIGDVPAEAFGPQALRLLADRVREGAGLMMLGGLRNFGPGGYAGSPIADLLPVALAGRPGPQSQHDRPLQMLPTRAGLSSYVMGLSPGEGNVAAWRALPPLAGASRLTKRAGLVEVLAESEDGVPLLFAHEVGKARVLAFAGDTTYLWYTGGHEAEHQRFWRQIILWLARKEYDTDQPVWVIAEPRNVAPSQGVTLTYGARDEKGQPVPDAAFELEVLRPDGTTARIAAAGGGERNTVEFAGTADAGDYWVKAAASKAGRPLGYDAWTRFLVDPRDLELDNPAADPALLAELAQRTGGVVVPPEQLASVLDRWLVEPPGGERLTVYRRTPLWDNTWFLLLFAGLMTTEWFLRKRRGLV